MQTKELIFVSCPNGYYKKHPNLRTRAVEEWNTILIYTPHKPNIHYLNPTAWLIFELCDNRTYDEITKLYQEIVPSDSSVTLKELEESLNMLLDAEIVICEPLKGGEKDEQQRANLEVGKAHS
ncbi:PqqD family protein [Parageobacillus toebii]|nr:hypothetical protein CN643_16240 [Parageobacillus yumthangensis]PUF90156.1 PqqD family protein [Geobacillus sp. LYN3]RDV23423.1 PqqD family protein [Parageobacillus toebii]TXK86518.1 PqqD family protein [Geobacillus sp. AYS3]TXK89932.1 PqqD family protein [Parageobacillus sp. SY1]